MGRGRYRYLQLGYDYDFDHDYEKIYLKGKVLTSVYIRGIVCSIRVEIGIEIENESYFVAKEVTLKQEE